MEKRKKILILMVATASILTVVGAIILIFGTPSKKNGSITIMTFAAGLEYSLCDKKIELTLQDNSEGVYGGTYYEQPKTCTVQAFYKGEKIYSKEVTIYSGETNYLFIESSDPKFIKASEQAESFEEGNPPPNVE